jgi:hypothetical protein
MGELVSDQIKRNYLQGVNRYGQFSYIPAKEKLVCLRESLVIVFQSKVSVVSIYDI